MEKGKKWLIAFVTVVAAGLLLMMSAVIIVDPFFQYHKPLKWFPYMVENQIAQNPGIAKNTEYDSVLLGSSMIINFNTLWIEEEFGLEPVKLPYNAAGAIEQDVILDIIEKYHGEVEAVFLGIDVVSYHRDLQQYANPLEKYLYDDYLYNDVKYWWNKDVLLNYVLRPLVSKKEPDDFHILYNKYYNPDWYDEQWALSQYKPESVKGELVERDAYIGNVKENMERYILPHIERHPNTKYYIFFPPYSILFWHDTLQVQNTDATIAEYYQIMEMLFPYDNVEMFFFAGDEEIICNLNNYKDYTHYSREVSKELVERMAAGKNVITSDNYRAEIERLTELIYKFDFGRFGL